jgi:hypothetical protein
MEYISPKNMNMRPTPNVNNSPIKSVPANTSVPVLETYEYSNGDKWAKVTYQNVTGWIAVIHLGVVYGTLTETQPPTEPPTAPAFPQSFTLTNPDGNSAEYAFVRIIQ